MATNKVVYGNDVVLDLTSDTVTAETLGYGYTAHGRDGELITGTAPIALIPYIYDLKYGYIANGTWKYEDPTNTYTDIYEIVNGHHYFITLGANVGSRFRAMTTDVDVSHSSTDVAGTQIINVNNPNPYHMAFFDSTLDGYLLVAKDNVGKSGIKSYVYDSTISWE